MSHKKTIIFACVLVTLFGQAFGLTASGEVQLNSAGNKPTVSGEVKPGNLNSAEDYVPLYESNTDEPPLYSAPVYNDNDYIASSATTVKTGPEQVLFLIVALLLAILIYKRYHPFSQK
jgi:hypothetical protein